MQAHPHARAVNGHNKLRSRGRRAVQNIDTGFPFVDEILSDMLTPPAASTPVANVNQAAPKVTPSVAAEPEKPKPVVSSTPAAAAAGASEKPTSHNYFPNRPQPTAVAHSEPAAASSPVAASSKDVKETPTTPTPAAYTPVRNTPSSSTDDAAPATSSSVHNGAALGPQPKSTTVVSSSSSTEEDLMLATATHSSSESSSVATVSNAVGNKPSVVRPSVTSGTSATAEAAANNAGTSSGMSGGAIAGVVIAVLLGIAALGALVMYFMKKKKSRDFNYGWSKMDEDVTPFRDNNEKPAATGYYGATSPTQYAGAGAGGAAAIAGSRSIGGGSPGGLDVPRQNAFFADGSPRPVSDVGENFAGFGAGRVYGGGPYAAAAAAAPVASYGINQTYSDHPNSPQYAQAPYYGDQASYDHHAMQPNPFEDPALSPTHSGESNGARQLVGPGQQYAQQQPYGSAYPVPAPVPLGRPEAPNSYDEIAAAEMYADDRYADDQMAAPATNYTYPDQQNAYSPYPQSFEQQQQQQWPPENLNVHPTAAMPIDNYADAQLPIPEPIPLPQLAPMSPLMEPITLDGQEDETSRMYGEVAAAAGIPDASARYQHGLPLAPVEEVATPMSEVVRQLPGSPPAPFEATMPTVASPPAVTSPLASEVNTLPAQPQVEPEFTAPAAPEPTAPASPVAPSGYQPPVSAPIVPPPTRLAPVSDNDDAYGGI